jgi:precorrin-6B methylase 1
MTLNSSNKYRIKVVSTLDGNLKDYSDNNFSVVDPPSLLIYPNPSSQYINVSVKGLDISNYYIIRIIDQYNKEVMYLRGNTDKLIIPIDKLNSGIYYVNVITNKNILSSKFVVIK